MMKSSLSEQIVLRDRSAGLVHVTGEFLRPMIRIRTGPAAAACHRICSVKNAAPKDQAAANEGG